MFAGGLASEGSGNHNKVVTGYGNIVAFGMGNGVQANYSNQWQYGIDLIQTRRNT